VSIPLRFGGKGILLDIEGTTSSVSFVYDVMFPFVRRELDAYLREHADSSELVQVANELGIVIDEPSARTAAIRAEVLRLMDGDVKSTGLKRLQGLIWESGFASGELLAHVYDDVPPALAAWVLDNRSVRIYSSGSIQAQKLFFAHTIAGNLLPLFSGHYDTTTGPKKEAASYVAIAYEFALPPGDILFLSDIVAELDAARTAGLKTALVVRPGNASGQQSSGLPHPQITSFAEIELVAG
jgi:enolase-phosphatase E1